MSIDAEALARLRILIGNAAPGPVEVWDSCSWTRVMTADGRPFIVPCVDRDGHPNMDSHDNIALAVAAVNALPALLDIAEAARAVMSNPEFAEIACLGSMAPCEDDLGKLKAALGGIVPCTGGAE